MSNEIYLDVETLRLADEVNGGWNNISGFGLALAVTWNDSNGFRLWSEDQAPALITELARFDRVVTFNGDRFDFEVLSAYASVDGVRTKSLDLLADLKRRLGFRIKLETLARQTLGTAKGGSGLDAVRWWREGRRDKVAEYCQRDVQLLVDLVCFARAKGHVIVDGRPVPVDWH